MQRDEIVAAKAALKQKMAAQKTARAKALEAGETEALAIARRRIQRLKRRLRKIGPTPPAPAPAASGEAAGA